MPPGVAQTLTLPILFCFDFAPHLAMNAKVSLLLALRSGFTPGDAPGTIRNARDQTKPATCKAAARPTAFSPQP